MNPLNLVADCDTIDLIGDATDPGVVMWQIDAHAPTDARTLVRVAEHYDPWCHCGPNGGWAVPGAEHKDECTRGRPNGDPPEGLYCLAAVLAEYHGATLHVAGPLRHGWPPAPMRTDYDGHGQPILEYRLPGVIPDEMRDRLVADVSRPTLIERMAPPPGAESHVVNAQFTVDDAHRHPHGMPETWDDAGGCTYPDCPVVNADIFRTFMDLGARHGTHGAGQHGYTPGPDSTQGHEGELRTQQAARASSDVRMPAPTREPYMAAFWRDAARTMSHAIDQALVADALRDACLVVVYNGSGSPGTGMRVCGQRRPCPDHETVEHDETCQHDAEEPSDTEASEERPSGYCGFAYPHQPHLWHVDLMTLDCPGKPQTTLYDAPREGVTT